MSGNSTEINHMDYAYNPDLCKNKKQFILTLSFPKENILN